MDVDVNIHSEFEFEEKELLDVVDVNDTVVDSILRSDMMKLRETPGRYLRVVELFLQRSNGDVYIPRRSVGKKIFPGSLDHSAAGHMIKGETYEQAVVRETYEELGIKTTPDNFVLIKKFQPSSDLFYFRKFYLLRSNEDPKLSPEHTEAIWLPPEELFEFVQKDIQAKQTIYEDIPLLVNFIHNGMMEK